MHIGDRIKARRVALGWSQRQLAEKMGYKNHSVVARVESGVVDLPQSRLDQFSKVLGISHGYLLGIVSEETDKKNSKIAELTIKMRKDPEFLEVVSMLAELEPNDYNSVKHTVLRFGKK